ncbi:hypothetical protein [Dyadobacter sp. 3J3]|uniref:hypothetical protein n=1 Tax=Dyadobacter sp. 3J3 TaxID=2606600 RepID=UPI00135A6EE6|nr:hypothetical protein [Dyadobacter sp. 3J3]
MQITDIKGEKITVTVLTTAIKQAALFKLFRHKEPGRGKRDDELKIYWSHIHSELLKRCFKADAGK